MNLKWIHSKPIFVQLVAFSLIISLIPLLIIGTFLFKKLEQMAMAEMENYHIQITSQYTQNIKKKLEQYHESLGFISVNTLLLNMLEDQDKNPYIGGKIISEEVTKSLLLGKNSEIRNCIVYSMINENPVYGNRVSMIKEAAREPWYKKYSPMKEEWTYLTSKTEKNTLLSIIKKIERVDTSRLSKTQLGIVKLDVYMEKLFGSDALNYDVIVFNKETKEIIYATSFDKASVLEVYWARYGTEPKNSSDIREADNYIVEQTSLDDYGMEILFLFDNAETRERRAEILKLLLPLALVLTFLVIGGSYLYGRRFSTRISSLLQKFSVAETGDFTIYAPIYGEDEIAKLDSRFSHMLKALDQLIQKNYIQELENKEIQLKNLQLQINPHFLYNTLETISATAATKNDFIVCDMCYRLGEIFRYSLGKDYGENVSLEQELTHIQNYIFIQKIRYGNRFEVSYHIDVHKQRVFLPRFILQPIVENAIMHGLGERKGSIEIFAYEKDDMLCICVADDGVGMDAKKTEELRAYIHSVKLGKTEEKNIGIRNVNQRIQLLCGQQFGIVIESRPQCGSKFILQLPVIVGSEK